jgi:integrase
MVRLFGYLERADLEGLGIRLQFAFAARMSEIISMEWDWIDFVNRRIVWPDSKTGEISKPMSEDVIALLSNAPRLEGSSCVVPSIFRTVSCTRGDHRAASTLEILKQQLIGSTFAQVGHASPPL